MMLLMSPTRTLPHHGQPLSESKLSPWTAHCPGTWLARPRPHACSVSGCGLMRAHVATLWSRVACSVERAHTARLAVARLLPPELCRLCMRRAPDSRPHGRTPGVKVHFASTESMPSTSFGM